MRPHASQRGSPALDLQRRGLQASPGSVTLRPKSLDVLLYLVKHAGRVVGKEELMTAVWPNAAVSDESLTQCISEARRAIRDDNKQVIRTIPKRGYVIDDPQGLVTTTCLSVPGAAEAGLSGTAPDEDRKAQGADPSALHQDQKLWQRWTFRSPRLAALAGVLVTGAVAAISAVAAINAALGLFTHSFDGPWYGGFTCDKLPFTSGPLITHIEVNVSGGTASYSRPVLSSVVQNGIEGVEQGAGLIDPRGTINLAGGFAGKPADRLYPFAASYSGVIAGRTAELRGTQVFNVDGQELIRNCSIKLSR